MKIVREHMAAENAQDFDAALADFSHPHFEVVPTGEVFDGEEAVRYFYKRSRDAFPDHRSELIMLFPAEDAVVVEFWLHGTRKEQIATPAGATEATGQPFKERMCAIFEFHGDRIACERLYFDRMSLLARMTDR